MGSSISTKATHTQGKLIQKVCLHVLRTAIHDVRAMRTATTLSAAGFDVTVVDITGAAEKHSDQRFQMHHLPIPDSFSRTRFTNWTLLKAVILCIRSTICVIKTRADIYHASEITALPACYLAAWIQHKPIVFEAYELPLQDYPLQAMSKGRRVVYTLMKCFLTHVLPRCTAVITVSQPIQEEIQTHYAVNRIQIIRNLPAYQKIRPTNLIRQYLDLPTAIRIALYQGNLQPDRGLDTLVQAATFLQPDVTIVMMGQGIGETKTHLEALIATENVQDRVKIIPAVPYADLLSWTSSADIGLTLLPSDYTMNMRMALPNKLFEYIMAGLPVLSSPLETIRKILTTYDTGCVVPSMQPAAIGHTLNTLIHDTSALTRMHENALKAAHELCWEQECPQLVHLYTTLREDQ